jgi:hypothetical protein
MQDIWLAIQRADVIIADVTGRNPNVFYELGIAHTLGRRSLILSQRSSDIPFDISAMRHLTYEWTGPESFTPLVRKLGGVLSACLV